MGRRSRMRSSGWRRTGGSGKAVSTGSTSACERPRSGRRMAEPSTPGETGITIVRVFDAPREQVWKEWTEPERFADWYGGSEAEIPMSTVSMDVKEGGAWRATMYFGPDRREIQWKGEYQEVVEPERLVFTVSDQPGEDAYELV